MDCNWPVGYGFLIFGNGPSFIIAVERNSVAEESGLKPGDQLLQVNDEEVADWSAAKIIEYVRYFNLSPPSLGVVSRIKEVTLMSSSDSNKHPFGISLVGSLPVMVKQSTSNLKINDIIIKIEQKFVKSIDEARHLLAECSRIGVAQVGVIPSSFTKIKPKVPPKLKARKSGYASGKLKAKAFLDLVKASFNEHPLEIENIVSAIKNYSKLKDTDRLAFALCRSFQSIENGKELMHKLRFFIPHNCKDEYDMSVLKYWKRGGDICSTSCSSIDFNTFGSDGLAVPPSGKSTVSLQHDSGVNSYVTRLRSVTVKRGTRCFGLTLMGGAPIEIRAVDEESPAFEANLGHGDQILAVNGIDIRKIDHNKAVALIQGSGSMPTLVIRNSSGALPKAVSPGNTYIMQPDNVQFGSSLKDVYSFPDKNNNSPHRKTTTISPVLQGKQHDWTRDYVPEEYQIQGLSFREQIGKLLNSDEIRVLKTAMFDFMESRDLNSLFFQLFPFLEGIDDRRRVIWSYIVECLTGAEKRDLKQQLLDFAQYNISDIDPGVAESTPKKERPDEKLQCAKKETLDQLIDNAGSPASNSGQLCKVNTAANPVHVSTKSDSGATRRHRRRRTVEKVHFSPEERLRTYDVASSSVSDVVTTPSRLSAGPVEAQDFTSSVATDNGFYDNQQQIDRRRRRELSSRRRRSVAIVTSTDENKPSPNGISSPAMQGAKLTSPRRQRPRRKTVEISTTTTTTSEETVLSAVSANATANRGDKKSTKKQKNQETSTPVSQPKPIDQQVVPSTSIDDLVFEDDLIEQQQQQYSRAEKSTDRSGGPSRELDPTRRSKSKNKDTSDSGSYVERDHLVKSRTNDSPKRSAHNGAQSPAAESKELLDAKSPKSAKGDHPIRDFSVFNEFSNAEEMSKKKGYMNNLKKRLTFSRPPKNTDTDTFLSELSAQFDEEMHLVGDVEIEENETPNSNKFGEKWSYLPNKSSELTGIEPGASPAPAPETERPNPRDSPELHFESGERSLERDKQRRRRRRTESNPRREVRSTFQETNLDDLLFQPPPKPDYPKIPEPAQTSTNDETIYDVPKPVVSAQSAPRRSHVNVERRRRSRANRPLSMSVNRNSAEVKMQVWTEGDRTATQYEISSTGGENTVKLRSPSPENPQSSFFDRAKKRNYRVSGISMNMQDIFSEAEEDLQEDMTRNVDQGENFGDPDEIYAPLHDEVLALGLAYEDEAEKERREKEEREEREREERKKMNEINKQDNLIPPPPIMSNIPPPPTLTGIPPPPTKIPPPPTKIPPPPTLSPPGLFKNPASPVRMSVKRINWEKIEPVDLGNTVWGQLGEDYDTINDVVKYLDLEEHFSVKKTVIKKKPKVEKKTSQTILAHKKAYNLSILLAHLKLTRNEIYNCLIIAGPESVRKRLDSSHYEQLLLYAPDKTEIEDLKSFNGETEKLNEADKLVIKLVTIPGYELRLKALAFKYGFAEKEEEIRKNLEVVQKAAMQLRKSRKLAKILEFVLAMGNYMNQGHIRISKATGFRIHFLAEMDYTKTSDNKLTFLHILARAVCSKFPDVVTFSDEIYDVKDASRVVYPAVLEDLQTVRKVWLDIRDNLLQTVSKIKQDRFKVAMETCLVRTNGAIKRLEQLHNATVKEFNKVAQYFGENPKNIGMQQFFKIFDEFTRKFLKSHFEIKRLIKSKTEEG